MFAHFHKNIIIKKCFDQEKYVTGFRTHLLSKQVLPNKKHFGWPNFSKVLVWSLTKTYFRSTSIKNNMSRGFRARLLSKRILPNKKDVWWRSSNEVYVWTCQNQRYLLECKAKKTKNSHVIFSLQIKILIYRSTKDYYPLWRACA